jgi:hypothetical protein
LDLQEIGVADGGVQRKLDRGSARIVRQLRPQARGEPTRVRHVLAGGLACASAQDRDLDR